MTGCAQWWPGPDGDAVVVEHRARRRAGERRPPRTTGPRLLARGPDEPHAGHGADPLGGKREQLAPPSAPMAALPTLST